MLALAAASAALLAACGGSGNPATSEGGAVPPDSAQVSEAQRASVLRAIAGATVPAQSAQYQNLCATPRMPDSTHLYYPDRQGTLDDEKTFLRLWSDETYLWYDEIPAADPAAYASARDYFNVLKTPQLTPAGKPKDRYHFTYSSAEYEELSRGVELGYGLTFVRNPAPNIPRNWRIAAVAPGSPAAQAGLLRGDRLEQVDGLDFTWTTDADAIAVLNAGLFPTQTDAYHTLLFTRGQRQLTVTMLPAKVDVPPVRHVRVFNALGGKVGYLSFDSHNAVSELQLIEAFKELRQEHVQDLVLDMRYNGGGLLVIASELAYMIAGDKPTAGKTFQRLKNNGKRPAETPLIFLPLSLGLASPRPAPYLKPLPTLNLSQVTILTGPGTCSASEALINGLRGVDVEVTLIGGTTCGKPYAFVPMPNCGTTYFTVQYQGVNHKGFGDFADGFAPTCKVRDDLAHAQGDPQEAMLARAFSYRNTGTCMIDPDGDRTRARGTLPEPAPDWMPVRHPVSEIAIRGN